MDALELINSFFYQNLERIYSSDMYLYTEM